MLQHQHSMPIPTNQQRDANRLGQVSMRNIPQQRQTILMGMQPQGTGPGVLVTMPPAPIIANTPLSPQATTKNSPVLVSTEGEVGAQSGQQRPQLLQHNGSIPNNLANTKEKTPMCLVNELARFNKIQHQYRLTNEMGPAHKKRFTVTLKLGEEEYASEGASIKKAQHSAAAEALQGTRYKHPPPKCGRIGRLGKSNVTPTVELNALAMKRGEPAVYTFLDPPGPYMAPQSFNYRGMYNQRYHQYNKSPTTGPPSLFRVSLRVGAREYLGEGPTPQAARHDAASKAVNQLKTLPVPEESLQHCEATHLTNGTSCPGLESDPNSDLKSPISLVHEIALKRNLAVVFEVVSEKGPPHMRTFITKCTVGDRMTTGEGNGKKVSKKRAAEKMLEELRKLPPTSPTNMATTVARMKRKSNPAKKKTRNLIKVYQQEQKAEPEYGEDINPISRLIQIQQAKKEREPVYSLLEERGVPRRREFVMEVSVGQHSHTGTGFNKRQAKRAAAEGLLQQLGYSRPIQTDADNSSKGAQQARKVTFMEGDRTPPAGGTSGRQLVPGLLLMAEPTNNYTPTKTTGVNLQTTATIAKELLSGGQSPTADALAKSSATKQQTGQVVRPKDQLLYLAQLLGFQVQFSDFPKGNHSEFLSLVSLSTEPPQVCHGAGSTTDASHDQAALTALRALSEMGLDYVAPSGIKKEGGTQGDGLHLSSGGIHKSDVVHSLGK